MSKHEGEEIRAGPRLHGYLPEASVISSCFGVALLLFGAIMLGAANHKVVATESLAEEYHIPTVVLGALILGIGLVLILFAVLAFLKMRRTAERAVLFA